MKSQNSKYGRQIGFLVAMVVSVLLPFLGVPQSWILFLFLFFVYLAMANAWNLLAGFSGLISLCQPAFVGLAAYTVTLLAWIGVPLYVGVIAAAVTTAAFAIVISVPTFRMKGVYFAIGTLIIPEVLKLVFLIWRPVGGEIVGGGAGYAIKKATEMSSNTSYGMAAFVGIGSLYLMNILLRSKFGLGLAAIRDNEKAAASSGIHVFRLKLFSFIIGAIFTGLSGGIFYISQGYVDPASAFSIQWTIALMLATILGGIGTEEGPFVGTVIVVVLHFLLAKYAGVSLFVQGIILTGIMLLTPRGIMGALRRTRSYQSLLRIANWS